MKAIKQIFYTLFICMFFYSQCFGGMLIGSGIESGGGTFPDIVYWFNGEANDTTGDYNMGGSECSSTDTSGAYTSGGTISSARAAIGTYSFFAPTTADKIAWVVDQPTDEFVLAGFFYNGAATWASITPIIQIIHIGTNRMAYIECSNDGDSDEISLWYREDGGTYTEIQTSTASLSVDTWYAFQVTVNQTTPIRKIEVFNTSLVLQDSAENTSAFTNPTNNYDNFDYGSTDGSIADVNMDNLMISNDSTRNFITDEEGGTKLINLTSKPAGACP